jgi:peptide/nickel transport system ATP-binding protein
VTGDPVLEVRGLAVTLPTDHGPAAVVRGVDFALPPAGTLGIVGESGCGKTMTALAIMRLLPRHAAVAGQVRLEGRDLLTLSEPEMCAVRGNRIGMVFQEPMTALNPAHPVGRQATEGLVLHRGLGRAAARAEARRLFDLVGIPNAGARLDDYPHQFSGGQRQRVVIAMALACQPAVLIADEPTTALDVTVQAQILDLLERLVAELRMALVLISHDLGVVGRLCERVAVMYAGRVVEDGGAEQVFDGTAHPYTRGLFGALPRAIGPPGGRLYAIPGVVPEPVALPEGCTFADRCDRVGPGCRDAEPALVAVAAGHRARCIRIGEATA